MTAYSERTTPNRTQQSKNFNSPRSKSKVWCCHVKGEVFQDHSELLGSREFIGAYSIKTLEGAHLSINGWHCPGTHVES
jgi:hypothetical protein